METSWEHNIDSDKLLRSLLVWFDDFSGEISKSKLKFSILGPPGVGKNYICKKFECVVCAANQSIRVIWVETRSEEDFVSFLEGFNNHSCEFETCSAEPLTHHKKLLAEFLNTSNNKHLFIIQNLDSSAEQFFDDLLDTIVQFGNKSVRVIRCVTGPYSELRTKEDEINFLLQQLSTSKLKSLVESVNSFIPDQSFEDLRKKTHSNPFLLKLAASFITHKSPIFGSTAKRFLIDLDRFESRTGLEPLHHNYLAHLLLSFIWNHLGHKHRLGKFAQDILMSSIYMKTWIPVTVLHRLKFTSSTYIKSKLEQGKPVSAITFDLLKNLGLLHLNDSEDEVRIPNLLKGFVVKHNLSNNDSADIAEFVLLNMRHTELFVEFIINPYKTIVEFIVPQKIDNAIDNIMAILRNPFCRFHISRSKGISVERMLFEFAFLMENNLTSKREVLVEMRWLIAENQFYMGNLEKTDTEFHRVWRSVRNELELHDKILLRTSQTICFLLADKTPKEAGFYLNTIIENGYPGIVDEECLNAHKQFHNCMKKQQLNCYNEVKQQRVKHEMKYNPSVEYILHAIHMSLSKIISSTVVSYELCSGLLAMKLLDIAEFQKLFSDFKLGLKRKVTECLYKIIPAKLTSRNIRCFVELLLRTDNHQVVEILLHGPKRKAQGELFRNIVQKVWIGRAGGASSSTQNVCDPDLIVLFKSFLQTCVILHRGCVDTETTNRWFVVQVDPKSWALAFIQWDLKEACLVLSEVVFTQSELEARNTALEDTAKLEGLNVIKRNSIAHAVVWMKNKTQDPWNYEALPNIIVSETDWQEINKGFLMFNKIVPLPSFLLSESLEDENGMPLGVFKDSKTNSELCESLTQKLDSILSLESSAEIGSETGLSFEDIFETVWGLVLIGQQSSMLLRLLELQRLTTSAVIVKELTLCMIRDLNEVFVGSVQIDPMQFSVLEKRRKAGFAQMVRSLFRMVYRRYNANSSFSDPQIENSTFQSFREDKQAAVILLSVIRILKFLTQFEDKLENKAKEFDETKHNIFPSKEEMQEVFRVLRKVCPGKFDDEDSGMSKRFNNVKTPPLPLPGSAIRPTNCGQPFQSQILTRYSAGVSNQTDFESLEINFQPLETCVNKTNAQGDLDILPIQQPTNTNSSDNVICANNIPETTPISHSSLNTGKFPKRSNATPECIVNPLTCESDGANYNSAENVVTYQTIGPPIVTQSDISESNGFTTVQLKYSLTASQDGKSFVDSVVLMKYPAYGFEVSVLNEAYDTMKEAADIIRRGISIRNPNYEAGKVIFRRIFSQDEIENSNLSGRRSHKTNIRGFFKDPDLSDRSNALLDIVPVLAALIELNRPVLPSEMPPGNVDSIRVEVNDLSRKRLKRKIFSEYRYQMSNKPKHD